MSNEMLKKRREEVLGRCIEISSINEEIQSVDNHPLIKKMSQHINDRSLKIRDFCSVEKYNVFFNGKVGIGKSSAICAMFGLLDFSERNSKKKIDDVFLLKTGTGRTTICETEIIPNREKTELIIEPVQEDFFNNLVLEFVRSLKTIDNNDGNILAEEEKQLIKNMASIPLNLSAIEILKEFEDKDIEKEILEIINYNRRNKLSYEKGDNPFNSWLKKLFSDVNCGKVKEAPMPKKITIHISTSDTPQSIPDFVGSIFDTRGIDGGERPDIQNYIKQKDSISIMCDEINAIAGYEVLDSILKQTLIEEDKDNRYRVILMGIDKAGDLDEITGFEGDRCNGIKFKKNQALEIMKRKGINFCDDNVYLIDTIAGFSLDKKVIRDMDENVLIENRKNFQTYIEDVLMRMYSDYNSELLSSLSSLEILRRSKVDDKTFEKIREIRMLAIEYIKKLEMKSSSIQNKFEDEIMCIYHSSLRGAVNHYGIGKTADVYGTFQKSGGEEFIKEFSECKTSLIAKTEQIFSKDSDLTQVCAQHIIDTINGLYKEGFEQYRQVSYDETYDKLYNYDSWKKPYQYWGDGKGDYKQRVWKDIDLEIEAKGIYRKLDNQTLRIQFLEELVSFLDV